MYANVVAVAAQPIHPPQYPEIFVTDALLEDLLYLYAEHALEADAAESFVTRADDDALFRAVVRQVFCRACLSVNAALEIQGDADFRAYVAPLELSELAGGDAMLGDLLQYILRKLGNDADDAVTDSQCFEQRMAFLTGQV